MAVRQYSKIRKVALGFGILVLLGLAGAYFFPQCCLCVDSGPVKADYIVVLGGGAYERPLRAAELYKEGVAPRIILTGQGDEEINRTLLVERGVPGSAIVTEGDSHTTWENAVNTAKVVLAHGPGEKGPGVGNTRVILVTSWYHSRRALRTFQKVAPGMTFYSRPSYFGYERSAWKTEGIHRHLWIEYVKFARYILVYRIWPL